MKVEIRHAPSYAVARCFLAPNEPMKAQPGSMMMHSTGISLEAKSDGGFFKGLGRMVGGESFHVTTFTAPLHGGWVDIIPEVVGDVFALPINSPEGLVLTRGAWLANDGNIEVKPDASLNSMFSGEGLVILRAVGQGTVVGNTYGAIDQISLGPNDGLTIDTGHLVAWEPSVRMRTRKAGGFMASWKSKEGLVVDVQGPGDIITQSRVPTVVTQATSSNNNFGLNLLG